MGAGVGSGVAAVAGVSVGAAVAAGCATAGGSGGISAGAGAAPPDGPPFVGSVLAPQASNTVISMARMAASRYLAGLEPAVVFALIGNPLADAEIGLLATVHRSQARFPARRHDGLPCAESRPRTPGEISER